MTGLGSISKSVEFHNDHYAMCGCKDLPGYPQRSGGK